MVSGIEVEQLLLLWRRDVGTQTKSYQLSSCVITTIVPVWFNCVLRSEVELGLFKDTVNHITWI